MNLTQLIASVTSPVSNSTSGRQAATQTYLKYQPLFDALLLLRHQKAQEYTQGRRAVGIAGGAAAQGIEKIAHDYQDRLHTFAPGAQPNSISESLGIGPQAVSGILAEQAAMQRGGVPAQQLQLRSKYLQDKADIATQLLSTLKQAGAANTGAFMDLSQQRRKERTQASQFNRSLAAGYTKAGLDPRTGQPTSTFDRLHPKPVPRAPRQPSFAGPGSMYTSQQWAQMTPGQRAAANRKYARSTGGGRGGSAPLLPGGVKQLSQEQHNSFGGSVGSAVALAKQVILPGLRKNHPDYTPAKIRDLLGQTFLVGGSGIPKLNALQAGVALDLALTGHVSPGKARALHSKGYSVHRLGY